MLIATDIRKASVHGKLRKPSTNRSEVVNPTSKKPPMMSQTQGKMNVLSLDDEQASITVPSHGNPAHHRQQDRAAALPRIHGGVDRHLSDLRQLLPPLGLGRDGSVRHRRDPVLEFVPVAT